MSGRLSAASVRAIEAEYGLSLDGAGARAWARLGASLTLGQYRRRVARALGAELVFAAEPVHGAIFRHGTALAACVAGDLSRLPATLAGLGYGRMPPRAWAEALPSFLAWWREMPRADALGSSYHPDVVEGWHLWRQGVSPFLITRRDGRPTLDPAPLYERRGPRGFKLTRRQTRAFVGLRRSGVLQTLGNGASGALPSQLQPVEYRRLAKLSPESLWWLVSTQATQCAIIPATYGKPRKLDWARIAWELRRMRRYIVDGTLNPAELRAAGVAPRHWPAVVTATAQQREAIAELARLGRLSPEIRARLRSITYAGRGILAEPGGRTPNGKVGPNTWIVASGAFRSVVAPVITVAYLREVLHAEGTCATFRPCPCGGQRRCRVCQGSGALCAECYRPEPRTWDRFALLEVDAPATATSSTGLLFAPWRGRYTPGADPSARGLMLEIE